MTLHTEQLRCTRPMRVIIEAEEWRMSIWAFYVTEVLVLAR